MKAYVKKHEPEPFLYPDEMGKILTYLDANGILQVPAEQVEGYYMMFSEEHCAGWLIVNDGVLAEFADYLAGIDIDERSCTGDACVL